MAIGLKPTVIGLERRHGFKSYDEHARKARAREPTLNATRGGDPLSFRPLELLFN